MMQQQGPGQPQQMRPQGPRGPGQHPNQMMDPNQQHMDDGYMMDGQSQQHPQPQVGFKIIMSVDTAEKHSSTFFSSFYFLISSRFSM